MTVSTARVWSFVALTFAVSTTALIPVALSVSGRASVPAPLVAVAGFVSVFGPLIGAVAVNVRSGTARQLLDRFARWRIGGTWYAVAVFGPLVLLCVAYGVYRLFGGAVFHWPRPSQLATFPLLVLFVLIEAVGEEVGWRGYLLPALRTRYGPIAASIVLGVIWWAWHMPLFFTARLGGNNVFAKVPPLYYLGLIVGGAMLFTWVYEHTRESTLVAVVMHGALNGWATLVLQNLTERRVIAGLFGACAVVSLGAAALIAFFGRM